MRAYDSADFATYRSRRIEERISASSSVASFASAPSPYFIGRLGVVAGLPVRSRTHISERPELSVTTMTYSIQLSIKTHRGLLWDRCVSARDGLDPHRPIGGDS
jgi:hypothetical protein